ncbi:MAG: uridylate kinase [Methanotrichaceae archaeon]|nr:uridylate kinase [Methanotrichaceae archaeon]
MIRLRALTDEGYSFLVIPGGGPMANLVRILFEKYKISQEIAHWMAILAMEQYGYFLIDNTEVEPTKDVMRVDGIKVLLPYQALLKDDTGIEQNWNYTSDSVAGQISARLDSKLIKVTDVDGVILNGEVIKEVYADNLIGIRTCIDQGTLRLLKGRCCWVLNGSHPEELIASLRRGSGGTIIKG